MSKITVELELSNGVTIRGVVDTNEPRLRGHLIAAGWSPPTVNAVEQRKPGYGFDSYPGFVSRTKR